MEPEPGEIDWDVAVTRSAFQIGIQQLGYSDDALYRYAPWTHEVFEPGEDESREPVSAKHLGVGLDFFCGELEEGDAWTADHLLGYVLREAVHGAVLASASEEFRDANQIMFDNTEPLTSHALSPDVDEAWHALTSGLHEEWVELYELQLELEQGAYTHEGIRAAHSAIAERCDISADDFSVNDNPTAHVRPLLIQAPALPAFD